MKSTVGLWGVFVRLLGFVPSGIFLVSCASTSQKDKEKVLDELLRDQRSSEAQAASAASVESKADEPVASEVNEPAASEVNEPAASEVDEPAASVADEPVNVGKANLAPALPRSTRLTLPLPRGSAHADLLHFINAYASVMKAYMPFAPEWRVFSGLFSKGAQFGPDEFLQYRVRVRENPDRSHWLFVWGVYETSHALLAGKRTTSLLVDRQQDFIIRMRTLVYLMSELEIAGMKAEYRNFLRVFYKNLSSKYFKRNLKDRPSKPRSLIEP